MTEMHLVVNRRGLRLQKTCRCVAHWWWHGEHRAGVCVGGWSLIWRLK